MAKTLKMKILLVNPKYPITYWSFKYALKFISIKAANPPLGLLTVASLLPETWEKKLVDMNVMKLKSSDILWADYIFISAMAVQKESAREVIDKCQILEKKIVAGGPLFSSEYENFTDVDHLILNEAEITLPQFLKDIEMGWPKRIYKTSNYAELTETPIPDYSLLNVKNYGMLNIQFSRGCPYNCEFCDITALLGHKVRVKSVTQILLELDNIKNTGWRGPVFFVDDNFIGNKQILKKELLPAMIKWMKNNKHPFMFTTEASVNLADDQELMTLMVKAGFSRVFVGIETPEEDSLIECSKTQNHKRDMVQCVKDIQSNGMEVMAGFIVGFDNDKPTTFQRQIDFIQKTGIVSAMVGLLNAPKLTKLYKRLNDEGRIIDDWNGDNTNYSMNFVPVMNKNELISGYKQILNGIYSTQTYYKRVLSFMKTFNPPLKFRRKIAFNEIGALLKSILIIGILNESRRYYWKLFFWSLFRKPQLFTLAITYSIYGYHYMKVFKKS